MRNAIKIHQRNWGGRRPGAGRPRNRHMTWRVQVTLPTTYIGWIEREAARGKLSRSQLFEKAINLLIKETKRESNSVRTIQPTA